MKERKEMKRRLLSGLLAMSVVLSMMSVNVFASADVPASIDGAMEVSTEEQNVEEENTDDPAENIIDAEDLSQDVEGADPSDRTETKSLFDAVGTVETEEYVYDGTLHRPAMTVTMDGQTLTEGTDYTVGYKRSIRVGMAVAIAKGTGSYTGKKRV